MKEVRISVNGKFQFAVKVADDMSMGDLTKSAAENMKISVKRVFTAPGLLNLVTG